MKPHYILHVAMMAAVTLSAGCGPSPDQPQIQNQPQIQPDAQVQKTTAHFRDQEPNELSWQYFSTERLPFANFTTWWKQVPQARRDAVMKAVEKQGILKPATERKTSVLIQAEACKGEGWKVGETDGRTTLQHGGGHTGKAATVVVDIPQAGTYRLWSHWWNQPGAHNSFEVHIRPLEVADFKYNWQQTVQGDYFDHRFAWQWFSRKTVAPVSYDADKQGFQWESSPMFDLPQGKVLFSMAPLISSGPYAARRVDAFLLTEDPLFVPDAANTPDSQPDDASSLVVTENRPVAGSAEARLLWSIRPGVLPLSEAPAELVAVWHEWRDAFINHLAEGKDLSDAERAAAEKVYFNADWNLIGTPAMVKEQAAHLQSADTVVPGFVQLIDAGGFKIDKGWSVKEVADTTGNRILITASKSAAASTTTHAPHTGAYKLWVRFTMYPNSDSYFEVNVTQNGQTVKKTEILEAPAQDVGPGYRYYWRPIELSLVAGVFQIELAISQNKGKHYQQVDAFMLTDRLDTPAEKLMNTVPAQVPFDEPVLQQAALAGKPVVWMAQSWTTPLNFRWMKHVSRDWLPKDTDMWTGFSMTDWPQKTDLIATSGTLQVDVQPGAMGNRVLHLTNPSDKPITITPVITSGSDLLSWRVVAYQYSPRYGWQPMPLLKRHQVTIPPHLTASLWLNFDARALAPGAQEVTLKIDQQEVNFAVNVTGTDIRRVQAPLVGGWARPWPMPEGWRTFADIGLTTVHGAALPKEQMQKYGIKLIVLMLGNPQSKDQVTQVVQTLKGMGLDYNDWVWEISDEPSPSRAPEWIAAAKDIKAADPNIRIWVNPGERGAGTPEAIAAMSPYIDIYCPYVNHWGEKNEDYQKLLKTLGGTKLLYTTPCFEEKSPQAPLELLHLAAMSLEHNRDGWDAFALRNYYSYAATAWDEVNAPFADQAMSMYPGAWDQVIGSRNLEAVREAVQRWKTAREAVQRWKTARAAPEGK